MNLVQRANIFQSFDALKGFRELLSQQERILVPRRTLSEDDLDELNRKVYAIKKGMCITIEYYQNMHYIQLTGIVSKINLQTKIIQIVKEKINLRDIVWIEGEDLEIQP